MMRVRGIREYQAAQNQQYLNIGDPNFVCDFQLDLELTTDHAGQQHVIFPPTIKLLKGPANNILDQNDMNGIRDNLSILWNQNSNNLDCHAQIRQYQLEKSRHSKFVVLIAFLMLFAFLINIYVGLTAELSLILISILIIFGVYIIWYYFYKYPSKINAIRLIWRTQFLELLKEYIDELQVNYNLNNNEVTDFKFVILYPETRSFGTIVHKQWVYIRITNGTSNHDGHNVFYIPRDEHIEEGYGEDVNVSMNDNMDCMAQPEGTIQDPETKSVKAGLGAPLLVEE